VTSRYCTAPDDTHARSCVCCAVGSASWTGGNVHAWSRQAALVQSGARMRAAALLAACVALCALLPCGAEYHVGDFVPTARRAQFHGVRGRSLAAASTALLSTPRAAVAHAVARPAWPPLPQVWAQQDGALSQLRCGPAAPLTSARARRLPCRCRAPWASPPATSTSWRWRLTATASSRPGCPCWASARRRCRCCRWSWCAALRCVCCLAALTRAPQTHTGGYLSAVHATAQAVPASYLRLHAELIQVRLAWGGRCALRLKHPPQEFRNSSHWPKHVLVHYSWREVSEVDSVAGLYVLFLAGARSVAGACSAVRAHPTARRSGAVGLGAGQRDAGQRAPADTLLLRGCCGADAGQSLHRAAGVRRKSGLIRRRL
jgi:hypothetical protein